MVCHMNSRPNNNVDVTEGNTAGNQYKGLQSILDAALGKYSSAGFHLSEFGDHALVLHYKGVQIGMLSQETATIPVIHEACQDYLESLSAS